MKGQFCVCPALLAKKTFCFNCDQYDLFHFDIINTNTYTQNGQTPYTLSVIGLRFILLLYCVGIKFEYL